jgi:hypothetical protein
MIAVAPTRHAIVPMELNVIELFQNEDPITIRLLIACSDTGEVICKLAEEESLPWIANNPVRRITPRSFERHEIVCRPPYVGELAVDEEEDQGINRALPLMQDRLAKLLRTWTFKQRDGSSVPPTLEGVRRLNITVMQNIDYELRVEITKRKLWRVS